MWQSPGCDRRSRSSAKSRCCCCCRRRSNGRAAVAACRPSPNCRWIGCRTDVWPAAAGAADYGGGPSPHFAESCGGHAAAADGCGGAVVPEDDTGGSVGPPGP